MENQKKGSSKVVLCATALMLIVALIGIFILINQTAFAEEMDSNWNYPDDWTKIGGDESLVMKDAETVLKNVKFEDDYIKGGAEHGTLTIEDIREKGNPAIHVMRTFLTGYFEGNYYIAVLVDLHMNPGGKPESQDWIRAANATIETHIYQAKKVGNFLVTYWPTDDPAGELIDYGPTAAMDTVTQTYSISMGIQSDKKISAMFSAGNSTAKDRLSVRSYAVPTGIGLDYTYGTRTDYLYFKPNQNEISFLNSTSVLKYGAIYLCDPDVEYYDINVAIRGEFFYDGILSNAIVRAEKNENFYMKPKTGFFIHYGI